MINRNLTKWLVALYCLISVGFTHCLLGYNYAAAGRPKQAINAHGNAIRLGDASTSIQTYLGTAYAKAAERAWALAILKQLQSTSEYVSQGELAVLHAALGDNEAAIASLEKAFAEHDLQLQFLKVDRGYDSLRGDPRYQGLLKRVGLSD